MTTPYLNRIVVGDVRETLKRMPDNYFDTCVTSPPYFGLRDYGTASWVGGDPFCGHIEVQPQQREGRETPGGRGGSFPHSERGYKDECKKCGAKRQDAQIGLEKTPEEYTQSLVSVFRDIKRVLKDSGTLFLNLGDSYTTGSSVSPRTSDPKAVGDVSLGVPRRGTPEGMKAKDLMGIPWMVAFALRADGWYLRSDIIWHKPNVMPSSVTDRVTTAHEYIFMLSKSPKYYFDHKAIAEPSSCAGQTVQLGPSSFSKRQADGKGVKASGNGLASTYEVKATRNKRSVWTVTTKPFRGAHFATFPPDLILPCILAGSPKGGIVIDPFMGAGTTGMVARRLDRNFVGCELNPEYAALAEKRIMNDMLGDLI